MFPASRFCKLVSSGLDEKILDDIFVRTSYADQIDPTFANGPAKTSFA
jgi:hypothetical protein